MQVVTFDTTRKEGSPIYPDRSFVFDGPSLATTYQSQCASRHFAI